MLAIQLKATRVSATALRAQGVTILQLEPPRTPRPDVIIEHPLFPKFLESPGHPFLHHFSEAPKINQRALAATVSQK